jgi:lysozyme
MSPTLKRWRGHLSIRRRLLAAAIKRKAPASVIRRRRAQVAQAERVVARHEPVTKPSAACAKMIAGFEGGQGRDGLFHPYQHPGDVPTQGYGHTEGVQLSDKPWTKAKALKVLLADLEHIYAPPVAALGLPLNQRQFDALVSAVYNLGPGILGRKSTLGRALRAREWKIAADALLLYDHFNGRVLDGLRRRRVAERHLFLS